MCVFLRWCFVVFDMCVFMRWDVLFCVMRCVVSEMFFCFLRCDGLWDVFFMCEMCFLFMRCACIYEMCMLLICVFMICVFYEMCVCFEMCVSMWFYMCGWWRVCVWDVFCLLWAVVGLDVWFMCLFEMCVCICVFLLWDVVFVRCGLCWFVVCDVFFFARAVFLFCDVGGVLTCVADVFFGCWGVWLLCFVGLRCVCFMWVFELCCVMGVFFVWDVFFLRGGDVWFERCLKCGFFDMCLFRCVLLIGWW